ncbi:MAG: class I SAM-dependent methyltransferase [Candidatus Heimdallarchaeota archaeon]
MTVLATDWDKYARNSSSPLIRTHYFFSVYRNYIHLLHRLPISPGKLLEIGSSTGQISLRLVLRYQLSPTLVDTSDIALTFADQLYRSRGISPTLINKDVLRLDLNRKFDLVHSHGLLEHFPEALLKKAFHNHVKHLQQKGWLVCWVPTPDIFYRINRWYLENTGQWIFGYEKPITLDHFLSLFRQENLIIRRVRHMPGWVGVAAQSP